MRPIEVGIWLAGVLQVLIASSNIFAPRMLKYRENLARVSPIVREIFVVQCLFIVLTLLAFAGLCFAFAGELAGGSLLGRVISGFLALFWGLRLIVQLFFYDAAIRRERRRFDLLFTASFATLTIVFALAAIL